MDDRFFEYPSLFLLRCPELLLLKRVKGMVSEKPEEDFFQDFLSFFVIFANLALLVAERNRTQIQISYAPET